MGASRKSLIYSTGFNLFHTLLKLKLLNMENPYEVRRIVYDIYLLPRLYRDILLIYHLIPTACLSIERVEKRDI
jgi:hypothetical protein